MNQLQFVDDITPLADSVEDKCVCRERERERERVCVFSPVTELISEDIIRLNVLCNEMNLGTVFFTLINSFCFYTCLN